LYFIVDYKYDATLSIPPRTTHPAAGLADTDTDDAATSLNRLFTITYTPLESYLIVDYKYDAASLILSHITYPTAGLADATTSFVRFFTIIYTPMES